MNKTGAKQAGSTHPGRYTPWNEPLSRPIIRTYSAEVTSPGEQSPASSQCAFAGAQLLYNRTAQEVKDFFACFQKFFHGFQAFGGRASVQLHEESAPGSSGGAPFRRGVSMPRPSRPCAWPACRSRRTPRPAAPAGRGCTGRTPPPPPSSAARRPARRTTWSWRSRPGTPSSP